MIFYELDAQILIGQNLIEPSLNMRAILVGILAFAVAAVLAPATSRGSEIVHFRGYPVGTIVVKTSERRLYYVLDDNKAIRYPVGVGRAGRAWAGSATIAGKYLQPAWTPPAAIRRDRPSLPDVIPGGSPNNPMGAAALTLTRGQYAIHGTNSPGSIGGLVSYGCIRMFNQDIMDLYQRVSLGTRVVVLR
jgi:lipoprotein-anchoring transpeptidase ErfK/SrfK